MSVEAPVDPPGPAVLTSYADVREGLRQRDLKQALYDAGAVVMTAR